MATITQPLRIPLLVKPPSTTFRAGDPLGLLNSILIQPPDLAAPVVALSAAEYLVSIGFDHVLPFDVTDGLNGRADSVGSDDIELITAVGETPEIHATPDYIANSLLHEVEGCVGRLVHPVGQASAKTGGGAVIADTWAATNFGITVTPGNVSDYDFTADATFVFVLQDTNLSADLNTGSNNYIAKFARNNAAAGAQGFSIYRKAVDAGLAISYSSTLSLVEFGTVPWVSGQTVLVVVNWDFATSTFSSIIRSNTNGWNSSTKVEGTHVPAMGAAGAVFAGLCPAITVAGSAPQGMGVHLWGQRNSKMSVGEADALWAIVNTERFQVRELAQKVIDDYAPVALYPGLTCNSQGVLPHYLVAPDVISEVTDGGGFVGAAPNLSERINYPPHGGGAFEQLIASGLPAVFHSSGSSTGVDITTGPSLAAFDTTGDISIIFAGTLFSPSGVNSTADRCAFRNITIDASAFCSMAFTKNGTPLSQVGIGDTADNYMVSVDPAAAFDQIFMTCSYNKGTNVVTARIQTSAQLGGGEAFQKASAAKLTSAAGGVSTGIRLARYAASSNASARAATGMIAVIPADMSDADFDTLFEYISLTVIPGPDTVATAGVPKTLVGAVSGGSGGVSSVWSLFDGPTGGTASFVSAADPTTDVTFSIVGTYTLALTATDSGTGVVSFKSVVYTVS